MNFVERVDETIEQGGARGVLESTDTRVERITDAGVDFIVRIVEALERKEEEAGEQQEADEPVDPFMPPYEEGLFVEELSETHVCVLNKFPVLDRHLLIVTRDFEEQRERLNRRDFAALSKCLNRMEGLGFYNGGGVAGASQEHKHLQLVGFPLAEGVDGVPIASVTGEGEPAVGEVSRVAGLAFEHRLWGLSETESAGSGLAAGAPELLEGYRAMLESAGLGATSPVEPYNLLVTRRWMMLVPRRRERWQGISVNALGYAGALLARDEEEREVIGQAGPMRILQALAGP